MKGGPNAIVLLLHRCQQKKEVGQPCSLRSLILVDITCLSHTLSVSRPSHVPPTPLRPSLFGNDKRPNPRPPGT